MNNYQEEYDKQLLSGELKINAETFRGRTEQRIRANHRLKYLQRLKAEEANKELTGEKE